MIIQSDDDILILFCAFRYALGRRTYMPGVVAEEIKKQWGELSDGDKKLIVREIKEAIDNEMAGSACDVETWNEILNLDT